MKRIFLFVVLPLFAFSSIVGLAQTPAKPAFAGTWNLNLAK